MVGRAEAARMTLDRHVVGRVGEHHRGVFFADQRREGGRIEGVAAEHAMVAEDPQISYLAEGRADRRRRQHIGRVVGPFWQVI